MDFEQAFNEYNKTFSEGSTLGHSVIGCSMCYDVPEAIDRSKPSGQNSYIKPHFWDGETPEEMMDRIKRSVSCGRNLFFEEWEPAPPLEEGTKY